MEEAATPLPSEETTPPVTNIYFGAIRIARVVTRFTTPDCSYLSGEAAQKPHHRIDVQTIMGEQRRSVNSKSLRLRIENFYRRATFPQERGSCPANGAGADLARSTACVQRKYSCFFRHMSFATETNRAVPPSNLESSFRPAFWLGVLRFERPLVGREKTG